MLTVRLFGVLALMASAGVAFADDSATISEMIGRACAPGGSRAVTLGRNPSSADGTWTIGSPVSLPSDLTLTLDGAHLVMGTGTFCNMFRADGVTNVTLVGTGDAVVDGGVYNGLHEKNARKEGRPPIWVNNLVLFTKVSDFRIEGIRFVNQRWWALNFVGCSRGVIRNLDFLSHHTSEFPDGTVKDTVSRRTYGQVKVKNSDGIDLRAGCHDILVENITGFTEDDTVALTCLPGGFETEILGPDAVYEISDVTVRNVRSACMCSNVRLLAQGGGRICRVLVDGVEDTSVEGRYMTGRGETGVNIGDSHVYRKPQCCAEDMDEIIVRNVRSRAECGVHIRGGAGRIHVSDAVGFDGCPRPFADERVNPLKGLPKVWMSASYRKPYSETVRQCKEGGVDVVQMPFWPHCSPSDRTAVLEALKANGMKGYVEGVEVSESAFLPVVDKMPHEDAVMSGGAYRGLAIDRHLYAFTPGRHSIVVEPPVYSRRQPYAKRVKDASGQTVEVRSGHYYGGYLPTGEAEVIVPLKAFDGRPHLKIIPCVARLAETNAVLEHDTATAAMRGSAEIAERRLVRLDFDLSGLENACLDKVGLAVYWKRDNTDASFRKAHRAQLSVFSPLTRALAEHAGRRDMDAWGRANGGTFPHDLIAGVRFGDECFNLTGMLDDGACSYPIWGFSPSGRRAFAEVAPAGLVQPRTWGHPEVYGADAYGLALYLYHRSCAELVRCYKRGVRSVAPGVKVFRNTTRGTAWSLSNEHDGSGQEALARELDFVHLDPYPVNDKYIPWAIPQDMNYMSGFARRLGKPLVPWLQAHSYAPCGLKDVTPEDVDRMWKQHMFYRPDAIMWLGFDVKGGGHVRSPCRRTAGVRPSPSTPSSMWRSRASDRARVWPSCAIIRRAPS